MTNHPRSPYQNLSHAEACDFFGVPHSRPRPDWKPYAVQKTYIEVKVGGERIICWGGGFRCGKCGYGIDIQPDGDKCPKCEKGAGR